MYWTVARTHPNCEKMAITNLERQDFNYYQPKILERKIRKNRIQLVESPLFPCYLFIQVVDKWRSLHSTHGIASLLGGSSPAFVRDFIIDDLRMREVNGYIQLPKQKKLEEGDRVTIKTGVFTGQQALVERMNAHDRQKILLALVNNKIKILVNESELEVA